MEGYKWLFMMAYSHWNEFEVYNAGMLTFYALILLEFFFYKAVFMYYSVLFLKSNKIILIVFNSVYVERSKLMSRRVL